NPWNLDAIADLEKENDNKVRSILQLRLHPAIKALKEKVAPNPGKYDVDLTYITSRGLWYLVSWKGDVSKSGGVATNIGIHFFDMLQWVFGRVQHLTVHVSEPTRVAGYLELEKARVRWFLSIDRSDLPKTAVETRKTTYRSITVNGGELEFSEGFTDLHTASYAEILKGNSFTLNDVRPSIEIAYQIRNALPVGRKGEYHPFLAP
ncbi:MAG: Gfo/Idh/MocA family oxidoreductase, partial [Desulfobacterales bacterium]|nr:Gfo/Idh/MocA family oxidoreductase [Desulfobacterales bacterium]